jgi:hypothetical protein
VELDGSKGWEFQPVTLRLMQWAGFIGWKLLLHPIFGHKPE